MTLPVGLTTFTLTLGVYTDAAGAIALVGTKGKLFPVDPATGKRLNLVHVATGQEIIPTDILFTIGAGGTATVGPLPHTDNAGLSTVGFAYRVEWQVASGRRRAAPDDKTFAVPAAAGATVDYDLLDVAPAVPGVLVPTHGVPAGGTTGQVLAKATGTDFDTAWVAQTGGGGGGAVASVNGQTGVVVLAAANVGAATASDITTASTADRARANHTGTQSADTLTDGTTNKAFLATERTKLTGIATGATANSSDATLLARANHTGTQAATTVTGLAVAVALTPTATKTTTYTAAVGDLAMMNVAGGGTVLNLPSAPADKSQVGYRAIGATTGTPLTINRGGSDTIGTAGATSASIPLADETVILQYDAANSRWLAIANVRTQASIDARYQTATTTTILTTVSGTQALTLPAFSDAAYDLTLTGNTTITLTGGTSGRMGTITVVVRQDATAGRTIAFPSPPVAWPGQVPPTLNVSAGKYDVLQFTTFDGGTTWTGGLVYPNVQPVTVPAAPVSLSASPSSTQVVLNWADAGNGGSAITGHKVYRGTVSGSLTLVTTLGAVSTYTDTGRTDGTTYYYTVTAINSIGEGPQSTEVASTPGHYLNVTTGGASTPHVAGMVPGAATVDLRALVQMTNWQPAANSFILSEWGGTAANNRFALYVDAAGKLNGAWYNAAGVFQGLPSTAATNQPASGTKWVRALMNPTAGTCTYYLSDDGSTWTQLGSTISGLTTTGVQTGGTAYALTAGQTASATAQFVGRIYKAQLLIGGASQASVNYTTATPGAATVVGAQGETWTTIAAAAVV